MLVPTVAERSQKPSMISTMIAQTTATRTTGVLELLRVRLILGELDLWHDYSPPV